MSKRRSSTFDEDGFPEGGALDFGYRLLMESLECEYLSDFLADVIFTFQ